MSGSRGGVNAFQLLHLHHKRGLRFGRSQWPLACRAKFRGVKLNRRQVAMMARCGGKPRPLAPGVVGMWGRRLAGPRSQACQGDAQRQNAARAGLPPQVPLSGARANAQRNSQPGKRFETQAGNLSWKLELSRSPSTSTMDEPTPASCTIDYWPRAFL